MPNDRFECPQSLDDPRFEEEVRVAAYLLWETEGRPEGREQLYWYRAMEQRIERLVREREGHDQGIEAAGRRRLRDT
jgi:hypothetical protein